LLEVRSLCAQFFLFSAAFNSIAGLPFQAGNHLSFAPFAFISRFSCSKTLPAIPRTGGEPPGYPHAP
jgi:hypothetical protein